ncbi:hypothetical protein ABBQ38_012349 [Trebouxia sp. C0009 RCD-2024]
MSLSGINTLTANLSMMVQSILGLIGTISFHVISIQLACAISAVCYYIMILNTVLPMIGLRPLLEPKDTVTGDTGSKTDVETKLDAQPSLHTVNITAVSASPSEIRP